MVQGVSKMVQGPRRRGQATHEANTLAAGGWPGSPLHCWALLGTAGQRRQPPGLSRF